MPSNSSTPNNVTIALSQLSYDTIRLEKTMDSLRDLSYAASLGNPGQHKEALTKAPKALDDEIHKLCETTRTGVLTDIAPPKRYTKEQVLECMKASERTGSKKGQQEDGLRL